MNRLQDSILDKISDKNNQYRNELDNFKDKLEQVSTKLGGDVVTASNYSVDFSSIIDVIQEKLINNIFQVVSSYVIKDLRNVESVNVQFIDKINDRIDSAEIKNEEDKNIFISNLNNLLNEKYLEIVRIKRTEFFDYEEGNIEVEECINNFITYLNGIYNFSQTTIENSINEYKKDLYNNIRNMFNNINKLYLDIFVYEIINSLSSNSINENQESFQNNEIENNNAFDFGSEIPSIPDIPEVPTAPIGFEIPNVPEVPGVPDITDINQFNLEQKEEIAPMQIPNNEPIEVEPEKKEIKKTYDVDEILKIAKSPIISMNNEAENKTEEVNNQFISVTPLKPVEETEIIESEFDEREIVNEMIKRLKKRLEDIDARQAKYNDDEKKVLDDEAFVNELIENSNKKKIELDMLEEELDKKENELNEKKKALDKKINDIMPFADAVLKSE